MDSKKLAILKTLIYSDIFSHPLTLAEVWYYYAGKKAITETGCKRMLDALAPVVKEKNGYYFLAGREETVTKRKNGHKYARRKLFIARRIAAFLGNIPTVLFIGVSGNVASGSAKIRDDIDFFIITKKQSLFTTRLLVLFFLQILGKRRTRTDSEGKDKICVNMLIDETVLSLSKKRHNLYTAREIAQLLPLFERDNTYQKFFRRNAWLTTYLPHASVKSSTVTRIRVSFLENICAFLLSRSLLETLARQLQLRLITRHKTNETITSNLLAFHPYDYQEKTLAAYERKLGHYKHLLRLKKRETITPYIDKNTNIFYTAYEFIIPPQR